MNNIYEDSRNQIHPTAIISPFAKIGVGNIICAYAVINDDVEIGDNNEIGSFTVIGGKGEIRNGKNYKGKVKIGSRNLINHHVTIDQPLTGYTVVGNDNFIMTKSHIGHDVVISNNVTISSGANIGGHTMVFDHATIGLNAEIHQRKIIGSGAMIGMGASITKNVRPFSKVVGVNKVIGFNDYKVKELDISTEQLFLLISHFMQDFE